jgi:hypothetical protein
MCSNIIYITQESAKTICRTYLQRHAVESVQTVYLESINGVIFLYDINYICCSKYILYIYV